LRPSIKGIDFKSFIVSGRFFKAGLVGELTNHKGSLFKVVTFRSAGILSERTDDLPIADVEQMAKGK